MVIVHKTELLISSSLFGCSQRNWLRHSADLQLCRMSCRRLWMPSGRVMLQGCAVTAKRCCLCPTKSATNIATSKTCSWPSASSTSASSSCRTTRSDICHGFVVVCVLLWMLSWLPLGFLDLSAGFFFSADKVTPESQSSAYAGDQLCCPFQLDSHSFYFPSSALYNITFFPYCFLYFFFILPAVKSLDRRIEFG